MSWATACAVLASLVTAVGLAGSAASADGGKTDAGRTASERAAATGKPVEVVSERGTYSTTVANPDGTYTLTKATTPQRVKAADGDWRDIDTTLVRRSDGTVAPGATAVDLAFSGGGSGSRMIRIGTPRGALELGWPGELPTPELKGATATYPNVLKGVDLELTATSEGFREILVVKTPEAAADPRLATVRLAVKGKGLQVVPGADGGLRAVDEDGNDVLAGPAGVMWDAAGDKAQRARSSKSASAPAAEPGARHGRSATQPNPGDHSAEMPVKVEDGAISVRPDRALLRGKKTVYPVRIDPPVGLGASERTVLSSDGDVFWQFNGDYGVGNCSRMGPYYCDKDHTNRMYFEFGPSKLSGKQVVDATFRAKETWSFTCDAKWVDLERTDNISKGKKWPGPTQRDQMGDRYVSAGRGDQCSPEQPDQWVEFNDNPDESDENLTSSVRNLASGKFSALTLMLRAHDEGDPAAWKRFDDNAELQVIYVPKPGTPSSVGIIPGNGNTGYCAKSSRTPTIVTRLDPMAQAKVQTQVKPKAGEEKGELQAEFVVQRGDDADWHQVWSDYRPKPGWVADDTLAKVRMGERADGGLYRMRARTQSHWTYGKRNGDLWSAYSSWCYFKIDSTAPKAPQITSTGLYTECLPDLCEGKGGPGVAGSFQFKPNTVDKDIVAYRWRLLTQKGASETAGSTVTVKPTPSLSGLQVLTVQAKDVRERWGSPSEFAFKVAPAAGPVGTWHFDDGAPGSTATVAKDTGSEGTRHDATLRARTDGTAAGWSVLGRRGTADYSLLLNDDVSTESGRTGYAATSAPAVNTGDSFTLSSWVLLTDTSANRVVASAPGANGSAFTLYYSSTYNKWVFNRTATDTKTNPVYIRSIADTANPSTEVWTHVAGVFDSKGDTDRTNDTIQLFVNGRPQGQPVKLHATSSAYTPWVSTEGLQFGRSKVGGAWGENFMGRLDEANVWQRALTGEQLRQDARLETDSVPATELVGYWDSATAENGKVAEFTSYALGSMDISSTGAVADPDDNELELDGSSGYMATTGPVVDETGSFTVTADVKLDGAKFAAMKVGSRAQVFGQSTPDGKESSWALWVEKVSADGYLWHFGRTATDAAGKVLSTASVPSETSAEMDTWVQVTGVYDATEEVDGGYGNTHLYLSETEQAQEGGAAFPAVEQGGGELAAGRGRAGGVNGHYLPASLDEVRVWTGAMTADQVRAKALGAPGDE
ncbi:MULTISPECIES: LamG-like jellyroll fold domain-containing protein [unclassified Streptomyces]|uniref:LamG-like jellyroll fold domain-containing protein n=1 Tax=unclassified Streptomyces TaxID=2593676 RepID=UPI002286C28C|nr:LamG-like jellyroll fold domain-containing protein [Streptomyces sp. Je 1-369]WAL94470.1 LamG domain-containing protein [Streptomyces sp. Je 1-369]